MLADVKIAFACGFAMIASDEDRDSVRIVYGPEDVS